MRSATGRFAGLCLFAAMLCAAAAPAADGPAAASPKAEPLFIIERSKNANVVHYDAQLDAAGKLDSKEPVIAYWIMLAEDGRREELNWIEKREAYGFGVKPAPSGGGYQMTLVAAPDRPITVKKIAGAVRAEMAIDGRPAVLEKIFISSTNGLTGPSVQYIELYGKDAKTGEKRVEKIVPK